MHIALVFTNSRTSTKLLKEFFLGNCIVVSTTRCLRFEIFDLTKLEVDIQNIKQLGPHAVKYWLPKSTIEYSNHSVHYEKFCPIHRALPFDNIFEYLFLLDGSTTGILDL